jgi:hypothetical protein
VNRLRKTIFEACLRLTLKYNVAERLVRAPFAAFAEETRMKKTSQELRLRQGEFPAVTGGRLWNSAAARENNLREARPGRIHATA